MRILKRQILFSNTFAQANIQKWCLSFFMSCFFCSCTYAPQMQPQINNLVVAGKTDAAVKLLDSNQKNYGVNNQLLYLMDYGMLLHLNGEYEKSIDIFNRAKKEYERLYTLSLTRKASTWLVNDRISQYRGEEFERVLINVFQALNYAVLEKIDEALVEARDVDLKLKTFNEQYEYDQKNVYTEDAFVRMLMGVMYEIAGASYDLNDAFISYSKAFKSSKKIYQSNYGVSAPRLLKENLLSLARYMGEQEWKLYRKQLQETAYISVESRNENAEVYFIRYEGFVPIKQAEKISIPLPDGHFAQIAFPRYAKRISQKFFNNVSVFGEGKHFGIFFELGEDIGSIAIKSLDRKRYRYLIKSSVRTAGKYMLLKKQEENIRKKHGDKAADWFRYAGDLYQIASEKADTRSWQTLPDKIRIGRLILSPGEYQVLENENIIHNLDLKSGDKRIIILP